MGFKKTHPHGKVSRNTQRGLHVWFSELDSSLSPKVKDSIVLTIFPEAESRNPQGMLTFFMVSLLYNRISQLARR